MLQNEKHGLFDLMNSTENFRAAPFADERVNNQLLLPSVPNVAVSRLHPPLICRALSSSTPAAPALGAPSNSPPATTKQPLFQHPCKSRCDFVCAYPPPAIRIADCLESLRYSSLAFPSPENTSNLSETSLQTNQWWG